ncbi:carboxymuconolactone decarboxylase family protein [Marinobacterium sedimentorum]|uniref:carboxymuconolactone decarboxylase family protein n=1 Tax=Marinobacterium sedimentorum TaxID=2927804 RepID=UPI0020C5F5B1|nr:carboxymuconolactone decarboxylase family protein [Marinobacterium sedimentorum]MCP8685991.1 carboxymuconolactone decarboxylase family protein [Marinobacterium sedimentorum]
MAESKLPKNYIQFRSRYKKLAGALDNLGKAVREEGPLDEKSAQLIQLAAAASIRSEGAVHSHCRRALDAGASADEIRHAVILLTSTLGFPAMMAALSWVEDVLSEN